MSGPLPAALSPVTIPASWVYGLAMSIRNRRYDRGEGVTSADRPVFSVGNITAGGAGKTPMVAWIADRLTRAGRRPLIAMRGYAARPGEPSDEQAEYAQRCPNVPVAAQPDRIRSIGAFLARHGEIDCVILDDGFQHRRLARDLDLVVVDASQHTFAQRLLPAGFLREPVETLRRADAVIVTRADEIDERLGARIERVHGAPPLAWCRHVWRSLLVTGGGDEAVRERVTWLEGRRVLTLLGVGNPRSVETQLESCGAAIAARMPAGDHERYTSQKLAVARGLCDGVDAMVTTAKDWVKLASLIDSWPVPIVVPELRLEFLAGEDDLLAKLLQTVDPPLRASVP